MNTLEGFVQSKIFTSPSKVISLLLTMIAPLPKDVAYTVFSCSFMTLLIDSFCT